MFSKIIDGKKLDQNPVCENRISDSCLKDLSHFDRGTPNLNHVYNFEKRF